MSVVCAAGPSALDFLNDPDQLQPFDIVFMDIMMPGMNGLQVLESLPSRPYPIVATTGSVEEEAVAEIRCVN